MILSGYLDLKKLSEYSSYSVSRIRRWLTDSVYPLPHYHIPGGKILVKADDFDKWMTNFKRGSETKKDVDAIINSVFKDFAQGR